MCEINEPCSIANSREIDILQIAEMDHYKALVQRGDRFGGKRVGGVHRRHALKVDMGAGKLRVMKLM